MVLFMHNIYLFYINLSTNCKKWLIDNRLSLHIGKTESILFGTTVVGN